MIDRPTFRTLKALAIASGMLAALPSQARAADVQSSDVQVRYRVSYGVVSLGHMDARMRIGPDGTYAVDATFGTGGLVRLIRSTKGNVEATGRLGATLVPSSFSLAYSYGDRSRARSITFSDGEVGDVGIEPAPKPDDKRTPPNPAQLADAIDPASALIVPTPGGADPCRRTARVFDGRALVKLTLTPSRAKPFRAGDWRGEVRVCDVAARAVAGMRGSTREEIDALRGATLALAPVPDAEAWIAVELRVPSSAGMVSVRAVELVFE